MTSETGKSAAASPLESLIAPLTPAEFFEKYYERNYYRTPQPIAAVGDLLSIDRIDEILSDSELPPSSLSMAKSGSGLAQDDYTYANGVIDRGAVLDLFRDGATIVMPQLHFADGRLYTFCLSLEKDFGARIQSNIYLTPSGAHGFGIHYDDHDVFILQVSGRKKWEIYGNRESLPFRGESFRKGHDETGELQDTFILNPGECLYVPRGMAHRAMTEGDDASLHITVGILVQSWAEFMLEAVAEVSLRIPEMRQSLPRSLYFNEGGEGEAQFQKLLDAVHKQSDFEATRSAFGSNFILGQGPRIRGALNAMIDGIAPDDQLRLRQSIMFTLDSAGDEPQLAIAGSSIPLKPDLAAQIGAKLDAGAFSMNDFDVEDADDLKETISMLVAYGLLEKVPA